MHPGDVDGDISLILHMPFGYSGHAIEAVHALRLSDEDFESLIRTSPALARRWLSSVAFRLAHAHQRVLQLSGRDLTQQLAGLLLDEERNGEVPLPPESLVALLGVRRPSINKVMRTLERRNLVRTSYGRVELLDLDALSECRGKGQPGTVEPGLTLVDPSQRSPSNTVTSLTLHRFSRLAPVRAVGELRRVVSLGSCAPVVDVEAESRDSPLPCGRTAIIDLEFEREGIRPRDPFPWRSVQPAAADRGIRADPGVRSYR